MAYQVLARKYRPQRFADVAGQQHVTVTLMNALTQGRIAHGYIFSGHRGIGKTTIARILAMALNCRNAIGSPLRPTAEPCEQCESCIEIKAGNAVDVIEIDAATNRGIDEIRELRDAARYRPARDRYKIYILDEAHQITDAAFNALLKTLEEPPEHIVFMMATTQPEDIPQTVRSRCQHFSFHAVKLADILKELRGIAEQEGVVADEAALGLLAEAGDGSMRDALSIMDQAIASAPVEGGRTRLDAGQIRELMGSVSNAFFERLLTAVDEGHSAEVMTIANELLDAGNSAQQLARQCVRFLRNCLMAKIAGLTPEKVEVADAANELLQTSPDEQRRAARTSAKFTEEELTRYLQVMLRTFDELGYRQEPRFHFELGLLKLVHLRRLLPMEEILSRMPLAPAPGPTSMNVSSGSVSVTAPLAGDAGVSRAALPEKSSAVPLTRSPFETSQAVSGRWGQGGGGQDTGGNQEGRSRGVTAQPSRVVAVAAAVTAVPGAEAAAPTAAAAAVPGAATAVPTAARAMPTALEPLVAVVEAPVVTVPKPDEVVRTPGSDGAGPESTDVLIGTMRESVAAALARLKSQGSAAEAMEDAEWTMHGGSLRIQTSVSPKMLPLVINSEAETAVRGALRSGGAAGLRIEILPGKPSEKGGTKRPRSGRAGSAQAKAEEHPMVQQAQRLFHAEIRKVIDLTEGK